MTRLIRLLSTRIAPPLVALLCALPVWAQEYEPVTEASQPKTDPSPFVIGAYGFIWVAVLVYVVVVARGLGRANREIEELRRRVDAASRSA